MTLTDTYITSMDQKIAMEVSVTTPMAKNEPTIELSMTKDDFDIFFSEQDLKIFNNTQTVKY